MRKTRLFTPGPTPLRPEAREALGRPIRHHRTEEFKQLFLEARGNLQRILKTSNPVVLLTSSGTGAMEAAVTNLLSTGDRALAVAAGKFGERWAELCQSAGIDCLVLKKEPGRVATAREIGDLIDRNPGISALLIQGCETSTGAAHDLEAIGTLRARLPDLLLIVDAITALLSQPVETDRWELDVVIGGSQKSLGLPPGLAFLSLSERAVGRIRARQNRPYYFNLAKELERQERGQTAFTPAISLIEALLETSRAVLEQGVESIIGEAELMARATRAALQALGFELLSDSPAAAVTAARPPAGVAAPDLIRQLQEGFGVKIAGGQSELKGSIIRVAHLGYFDLMDVFALLSAMELSLAELRGEGAGGEGLKAALEVCRETLSRPGVA